MRPRTANELTAPDRIARAIGALNPATTPRHIREYLRQHYVLEAARFLYDTMKGVQLFDVPTMVGTVVTVPASAGGRIKAGTALLEYGIGKTVGFEGSEGGLPGVITLPPLELHPSDEIPAEFSTRTDGLMYVEETEEQRASLEDRAPQPVQEVETIDPRRVAAVMARRKARTDG